MYGPVGQLPDANNKRESQKGEGKINAMGILDNLLSQRSENGGKNE